MVEPKQASPADQAAAPDTNVKTAAPAIIKANLPPALQGLNPQQIAELPQVIGTIALGEGHESVDGVLEITIPRAKLIQFTSAEATAEGDQRINPGLMVNSLTKEVLPTVFMPIFKFTNFVRWNPRKKDQHGYDPNYQPGEMIYQTVDVKDPRVQSEMSFGPNGEAPLCTRYMNFLCYFEGNGLPLILSFAKTSMKGGESLNSLMQMKGGNAWNNKYKLVVSIKEGAEGKYYVVNVQPAGMATDKEKVIGKLWFDMFHKKNIKIDEEKPDEDKAAGWEE